MSRHEEVKKAILKLLQEKVIEIKKWTYNVTGFQRGKEAIGTISSDNIIFSYPTKDTYVATMTYSIIVIDPTNKIDIVEIMFKLYDIFMDNYTLDNCVKNIKPLEVELGVAQAFHNCNAARFIMEVEFYV